MEQMKEHLQLTNLNHRKREKDVQAGGPNSLALSAALVTAIIIVAFNPLFSISSKPSIVVPAGVTTISFSLAGCSPVSTTIFAAPRVVCAAKTVEMSLGNPSLTPASAKASIIK